MSLLDSGLLHPELIAVDPAIDLLHVGAEPFTS